MKKWLIACTLTSSVALTACVSAVKPAYVSPLKYETFSCVQLQMEYNRLQEYINNGVETPKTTGVGVGLGLGGGWSRSGWGFGPSVSVNMGQSSTTKNTELARLLGEQEAILQMAQYQKCPMVPRNASNN